MGGTADLRNTYGASRTQTAFDEYFHTADVRKLVTRKYSYIVYYTIDEAGEEIIILTIQHPSRKREHEDA